MAAGFLLHSKFASQPLATTHPPVTLLIADFDNKTGDPVFDSTLEPMLGIALEGAPFISSFNRGQAKKIAARLQPGVTQMDAKTAQLVAVREGLHVVVAGSIEQDGGHFPLQNRVIQWNRNCPESGAFWPLSSSSGTVAGLLSRSHKTHTNLSVMDIVTGLYLSR